ncbi:esterase/lipase family protein [Rhodococcus aetherivorans]|jgi:triacylglycerol esterase/lipase EstA (alpha/beta hydrolase family)|nr:alpha/beta fold hydrolase [Rhodococcus aetherivorans]MDV6293065.1 alpha/beta fold hydrolase [Rhodococcus aetherivorans]NGP25779.1 alpha/beta fold hydrolase [Rhodococcus aetherivorans]
MGDMVGRLALVGLIAACSIATAAPTAGAEQRAAEATTGPPQGTFGAALAYSLAHPGVVPAGTNDVDCVPTPAHPEPVVLVHGFLENSYANWAGLAPALKAEGYCVFALDYGAPPGEPFKAREPIPDAAGELAAFVDTVLAETGAERVSIVGHSKGGAVPRWYVRFLGGADKTSRIVGLAPANYPSLGPPSVAQDAVLAELNAGSDTVEGVSYTVVATRYDQVIIPYTASFLTGPGAQNILLQDVCPANTADHVSIPYDPVAEQLVLAALDPAGARPVVC